MTGDLESSIQHPIARIQSLIDELKGYTRGDEYDRNSINALWNELEDLLVMLATSNPSATDEYRIARYRLIAAIVSAPPPSPDTGQTETTDADSDAASGRGDRDRGSDQSGGSGSEAGNGEAGDQGSSSV